MDQTERIVIDLDDTLTIDATNQLRPGAEKLLDELGKRGEVVLWTSGKRARLEEFCAAHPELMGVFAQTVCSADFLDEDEMPIFSDEFQAANPELKLRAKHILHGYEGGKIPPLVGSNIVIDDTAPWMQNSASTFGFRAIDAASKRHDPTPDAWVFRVLEELIS